MNSDAITFLVDFKGFAQLGMENYGRNDETILMQIRHSYDSGVNRAD